MNKISVVLMVYNRKEYYREALDSLANQNGLDFELLIYSNIDIEYNLQKFRQVDTIYPEKPEMAYWLSDALKRAKYDKIAFLDDDDRYASYKISHLKNEDIEGYYHNDYYDFGSKEAHSNGKGFNASCIAINKSAYNGIMELTQQHPLLGYMPDSMIYWYALEHNIPVVIDNGKLTYYRHKPYQKMYANLADTLHKQMAALEEASKTFKSPEVHEIIREVSIQNQIYLNSLGHYKKISINDLIWLMGRNVTGKKGKIASYFLSLPLWHGVGVKWMDRIRVQREVEK